MNKDINLWLQDDDDTMSDLEDSGSEYELSEDSNSSEEETSDHSSEEDTRAPKRARPLLTPTQTPVQLTHPNATHGTWGPVTGYSLKYFSYTGNGGILFPVGQDITPIEVYEKIVDSVVLNLITEQTNVNAHQKNGNWKDVTTKELKNFMAILIYISLIKYPKISDYWSTKIMYKNNFIPKIMPRNRFQTILKYFHLADNLTSDKSDRLYKIRPLNDILAEKFKSLRKPDETVVIDETMVPFRGRLLFKQYLPGKASKYGVKIFKLCDVNGYTYGSIIYEGKMKDTVLSDERSSNLVVYELLEDYLYAGRTLIADNYYNNLQLAENLLDKNTHLVGTLRKNVKGIPKKIMEEKGMKRGDIKGEEYSHGIVVGNWKDKRCVRFITTKHTLDVASTGKKNRKGEEVIKPEAILLYNKNKQGVDVLDQMSSYFTVLRRTIRWYHKVAFEFLFGTAIVNALVLYKEISKKSIKICDFREELVLGLLGDLKEELNQNANHPNCKKRKHKLSERMDKTNSNRKKRNRCTGCYKRLAREEGRAVAHKKAKLVTTFCSDCPGQPSYCLQCFQNEH